MTNGQLAYTGGPGESNAGVLQVNNGDYLIVDSGLRGATIDAGPGCAQSHDPYGINTSVRCPMAGVTSIGLDLGDRADQLNVNPAQVAAPITYDGGEGIDTVIYITQLPVSISADGVANDGPAGRDNVAPDVERLLGWNGADTLTAGPEPSQISGGGGPDVLRGGPGADVIRSAYIEDVGIDSGSFYAQGRDTVSCGGGEDYVLADSHDKIARDCEVVVHPLTPHRINGYGYEIRGSARGERIGPREFFEDRIRIDGRGGNDRLTLRSFQGGIWGGSGNDRLHVGSDKMRLPDYFSGGKGADRIHTRDEARDLVHCGRGRDVVFADHHDLVARDCERVVRR